MEELMERISNSLMNAEEDFLLCSDDEQIAFARRLALEQDLTDVFAIYGDCFSEDTVSALLAMEEPLGFLCERIGGKIDREDYWDMLRQMIEEALI